MSFARRPLIVGASGQVGSALGAALGSRREIEVILRSSREPKPGWLTLDLAGSALPLGSLERAAPDAVICTGGMTFVDGCEQSPESCHQANARGPATLASYAQHRRIPFVFFSTDYVFSGAPGQPGPYDETAPTQPLSAYGRSKLEGEAAVLHAHPSALIVRTTVVYGPDAAGKNFLYTLLRHLWTGHRLRVPTDQISTPTFNRDLAEATLALLDAGASGVVHVAGPELMDRLQFAREVARTLGLDDGCIEGVTTASLGQMAARPLRSGLVTTRLEQILPSLRRHSVREALLESQDELRGFLETLPGRQQ